MHIMGSVLMYVMGSVLMHIVGFVLIHIVGSVFVNIISYVLYYFCPIPMAQKSNFGAIISALGTPSNGVPACWRMSSYKPI